MYATDNLGQNLTCLSWPALSDITKEDFLVLCVLLCFYVPMCLYLSLCLCVSVCASINQIILCSRDT